jgi:hypothetical protein
VSRLCQGCGHRWDVHDNARRRHGGPCAAVVDEAEFGEVAHDVYRDHLRFEPEGVVRGDAGHVYPVARCPCPRWI